MLLPALLVVLPAIAPARAASRDVAVRATVPALLDIEPGSTRTATFLVTNRSDRRIAVLEDIVLAQGWQLIVGESPFELAPGEERLRLATFHVPLTTPAGSYTLAYEVVGQRDYDVFGRDEIGITVLPAGKVALIERDVPDRAIAGDVLSAHLAVVNHSNMGSRILVQPSSSEAYPVSVSESDFVLGPGESREITIRVETPRELGRKIGHVLRIVAVAEELDSGEAVASSTIVQDVVPRVSGKHDPYRRVPAVLKTVYVGRNDSEPAVQLELSGRGAIDEGGGHGVGFLLRTPDTRDDSIFGLREEYGLRLHGQGYAVQLGDGVYQLSRLTGQRRYGRGGSADVTVGRWELAGSYYGSRSGGSRVEEGIARLGYRWADRLSLGLSYVRPQTADREVVSIAATSEALPWFEVDLEYAAQTAEQDHRAYWARVRGARGSARYFLERVHATEGFPGRYSNEDHTTASVSLPVIGALRANAFYRDFENRGEIESPESESGAPVLSSTTREEARSLGLKATLPLGVRATIDYREVHREGSTATTTFGYRTETTRIAVERANGVISAVGSVEFGELDDTSAGLTSDVDRYSLTVNLRPGGRSRLSGHYQSALSGSPDPSNRSDVAGINVEVAPSDGASIAAGMQWRGIARDGSGGPDQVTTSASYTLPFHHRISGEFRWMRFDYDREPETALRIAYEIPIQMPVGRKQSTGSLRGRVSDAQYPRRPGMPDVILVAGGLTAVTDDRGDYVFPSLEPGEYDLTADPASVGIDRVPAVSLPKSVTVTGGRECRFDLGLTTPGGIEGEVRIGRTEDQGEADHDDGASGVPPPLLVEIACGEEVYRQMTDADGRFLFGRLRPGRWVLSVHAGALPRFRSSEVRTFAVDVQPGSTEWVTAEVVTRMPAIPILDTGDVKASSRLR